VLDTVEITLCLICTIKQDGRNIWVTGGPALDLFSQGKTEDDAKRCLEEAISLWVEDCIERGTLEQALSEAGFHKAYPRSVHPGDEQRTVSPAEKDASAMDTFLVQIAAPAYQAAALMAS